MAEMSSTETFHLGYGEKGGYKKKGGMKRFLLAAFAAGAVGVGIGILIGYFVICEKDTSPEETKHGVFLEGVPERIVQDGDPQITDKLFNEINAGNIEKYLRTLTETPRLAGTPADYKYAKILYDFWKENGADEATIVPYDILLSYPNTTEPSRVYLMDTDGTTLLHETAANEKNLTEWGNSEDVIPPILGFTAAGDVTAELVYANYGREEDFAVLKSNGVEVRGKVVICRYGKGYRGNKVKAAENLGAVGVIIYSDPEDWVDSTDNTYFPHSRWLPHTGLQRGSAYTGDGDALTPGYPATEFAYRYGIDDNPNPLPKIPAVPISYGDAEVLLSAMVGIDAPEDFVGALNISYKIGRNNANPPQVKQVRVKSSNYRERRKIYNVFGMIRGYVEPDRYIVIGAHRDAWVYGAIDNGQGTAVVMEVSRAMMKLVKDGVWKPKRTIIFSSWSAEEYGLIGATEWVEEFIRNLQSRTVAYLNLDCPVVGNFTFGASATPTLYRTVYDAAKKVRNPNEEEYGKGLKTVYDGWLSHKPWKHHKTKESLQIPKIGKINEGSDFGPFLMFAGIPAAEFLYEFESESLSFYSTYHSAYDNFDILKFYDPDYKIHASVCKVCAESLRVLADSLVIPFNVSDHAWQLKVAHDTLDDGYGELMRNNNIKFDQLTDAIANFTTDVKEFEERIKYINKNDPLAIRLVNDQMMLLERAFTDPMGLPGRKYTRNVISAASSRNQYGGSSFPGLTDAMFEIEKTPAKWEEVKQHFSVVIYIIRSASSTLRDIVKFLPNNVI